MLKVSGRFWAGIAGISAIGVFSLVVFSLRDGEKSSRSANPATPASAGSAVSPLAAATSPGAVSVPTALPDTPNSATNSAVPVAHGAAKAAVSEVNPYGVTQPVAGDLNPNVRSVVEAAQSGKHPERLATLIAPAPFDAQRFAANPQAYVDVVEPGRVFQSAQPGADIPVLRSLSSTNLTMAQDGQVVLRVRTQPLAPVTFTSFDLGRFSNQLVSQTVLADAHGVAATMFSAGPGTIDGVHVLAGSPMASGQVRFDIHVTLTKQPLAAVDK